MQKLLGSGVLVLVLALMGCGSGESEAPTLTPEEQLLVDDLVALYKIRILRLADPDAAVELSEETQINYGDLELEQQLDLLAADPSRGQALLEAVHDSLEALRPQLFPSEQGP